MKIMAHLKNDTANFMKKKLAILLMTLLICVSSFGQTETKIVVPDFKDKYSEYVRQLEAGETDIDYQDFRFSFIESEQFKIAKKNSTKVDSLKKEMYLNMKKKNYAEIIDITKQMLSIDYTSMHAHKILRQTYNIIGDSANSIKYKTIQFGLLNSIVKNGDGQSCATAWPVIQIAEEYFILEMIDAVLQKQTIVNDGGLCDKMEVKMDGKKKTFYFETSKIFQSYKELGLE